MTSRLTRRLLVLPALAATGLVLTAVAGAPAQAANNKLTGTVSWTRTVAINENVEGDHNETGTETTSGSLKLAIKRNALSYGSWNGTDKAASYAGTYGLTSTRNETDAFGTVDCVVTHAATGKGSGKVPTYASVPPGKTKGIVLSSNPRYTGTDTVTYTGQGISPCQSGQDVDPIDGSLMSNNDSRMVCYPTGTSSKLATPRAGDLVGSWNAKKKAFVFDCTKTYPENSDGGRTVTVKVTGTLKWS